MDRYTEITTILNDEQQVAALTDEELSALRSELHALAAQILAGEVEVDDRVAVLAEIADYAADDGGIAFVLASRAEARAAEEEAIAEQAIRLGLVEQPAAEVEEPPAAGDAPSGDEPPADPPAEGDGDDGGEQPPAEATAPQPVAVGAAVSAPAPVPAPAAAPAPTPAMPALAAITPPAAAAPAPVVTGGEPRIMRLADRQFVSLRDLAETMIENRESFLGISSLAIERVPMGRIDVRDLFPEERRLTPGADPGANNGKLDALMAGAWMPDRWTDDALVASGGFCAPAMPDYEIPQIAGTQRPVAGYLPTVQADRGSLTVIQPPRLSQVVTSTGTTAGSAVSIWTNTTDTTPGEATKPRQTVPCASPLTVTTEAIVSQLKFGNFLARAFPELVQTWLQNTAAAWARTAENELLRQIDASSTALTTAKVLGAARDLLGYVGQAAAGIRNRNRMPYNARLRLLLPAWVIDLVAADIAHQHAGDGLDAFAVAEADLRRWLDARNVNVTFYEDTATGAGTTSQLFQTATGGASLPDFPPGTGTTNSRVVWYLFPEGTFARADGGTLDLGLVRDSTLNGTNDYVMFAESWEAVVPKVIESLKVTSSLCQSGEGATDGSPAAFCTAS